MDIPNILTQHDHRPWPVPPGPWRMAMVWHDLLFAHWPIDTAAMRPLIPPGLNIDTFDGQAWIGVVPFTMSGIRPRGLPALPGLSAFPEINVRTYVRAQNKPGVYFFSLDAAHLPAVLTARTVYKLPYFWARMKATREEGDVHYRSARRFATDGDAIFDGSYRPLRDGEANTAGTSAGNDHARWLTERYCLYTAGRRERILRAEIHHAPWPLDRAEAEIHVNTMTRPLGITLPDTQPLLHFAKRLDVVAWGLTPVDT